MTFSQKYNYDFSEEAVNASLILSFSMISDRLMEMRWAKRRKMENQYMTVENKVKGISSYWRWISKAENIYIFEIFACRRRNISGMHDKNQVVKMILG